MLTKTFVWYLGKKLTGKASRVSNASRGVMMKARPTRFAATSSSLVDPTLQEEEEEYEQEKQYTKLARNPYYKERRHYNDESDYLNDKSSGVIRHLSSKRSLNQHSNKNSIPHSNSSHLNGTHNYNNNRQNNNKYKNIHVHNTYDDADVIYPGEETLFDGESDTVSMLDDDQMEHFGNSDVNNDNYNNGDDDNDENNLAHDSETTNSHNNNNRSGSSSNTNKSKNITTTKANGQVKHESRNMITNYDSLLRGKRRSLLTSMHKANVHDYDETNNNDVNKSNQHTEVQTSSENHIRTRDGGKEYKYRTTKSSQEQNGKDASEHYEHDHIGVEHDSRNNNDKNSDDESKHTYYDKTNRNSHNDNNDLDSNENYDKMNSQDLVENDRETEQDHHAHETELTFAKRENSDSSDSSEVKHEGELSQTSNHTNQTSTSIGLSANSGNKHDVSDVGVQQQEQEQLDADNAPQHVTEEKEEEEHHRTSETLEVKDATSSEKAEKSAEAYRFLLSHIDAEIAALQRRQEMVTLRRHKEEEKMTRKVKELFEFMESPWLLIPTEVAPPLPATGVDVYIKEQQVKRMKAHTTEHEHEQGSDKDHKHTSNADTTHSASSSSSSSSSSLSHNFNKTHHMDVNDKMFVLACHKNYRNLPYARKKLYEQAAEYNATLRQELRYRLSTGCSRFETFCESIQEATVELMEHKALPPLPTMHHSPRPWMSANRQVYFQKQHQQQQQQGDSAHSSSQTLLESHSGTNENNNSYNSNRTQKKGSDRNEDNTRVTVKDENDEEREEHNITRRERNNGTNTNTHDGNEYSDDVNRESDVLEDENINDEDDVEQVNDDHDANTNEDVNEASEIKSRQSVRGRRSIADKSTSSRAHKANSASSTSSSGAFKTLHTHFKQGRPSRSQQRALESATISLKSMLSTQKGRSAGKTGTSVNNRKTHGIVATKATRLNNSRTQHHSQTAKCTSATHTTKTAQSKVKATTISRRRSPIKSSSSAAQRKANKSAAGSKVSNSNNNNKNSKQSPVASRRGSVGKKAGNASVGAQRTEHRAKINHRSSANKEQSKHTKSVTGRSASIPLPNVKLMAMQRAGKGANSSSAENSYKLKSQRQGKSNVSKAQQQKGHSHVKGKSKLSSAKGNRISK